MSTFSTHHGSWVKNPEKCFKNVRDPFSEMSLLLTLNKSLYLQLVIENGLKFSKSNHNRLNSNYLMKYSVEWL